MSDPIYPYEVEVPGLGTCTVLDPEGVPGYRVRLPSGEVQSFAAAGAPTPENAANNIANPPQPTLSPGEAEALLDSILDGWARERGYASAARCITYVNDPDVTFAAEGQAMLVSRSSLWVAVRATAGSPNPPPLTEANVRAFAAAFAPVWPS